MISLKLLEHPILAELNCVGLGKINVVTGGNNSGKTLLLKTIATHQSLIYGTEVNPQLKESLKVALIETQGWSFGGNILNDRIEAIANTVINSGNEGYIYSNEMDEYVNRIKGHIKTQTGLVNVVNRIRAWFQFNLMKKTSRLYIPTKRSVLTSKAAENDSDVTSTGENLINKLFYLQGKLSGSSDRELYNTLQAYFSEITNGLKFHIEPSGALSISLYFSNPNGSHIYAEDCGLGLREVLMLLYAIFSDNYDIICLDEMESHLHPDMQRKLMGVIDREFQGTMLISTHSNVIINSAQIEKYYKTYFNGSKIYVEDKSSMAELLESVGYSVTDNLVSDLVILVEGKHDIKAYREILRKYGIIPSYNVKIWQLGGNDMDAHDLSVIKQNNKVYAIIDRDDESVVSREAFKKNCTANGIKCHQLSQYAFENYIPIEIIRKLCGPGSIPSGLERIDPNISVKNQGISLTKRKIPEMVELMDKEYIDTTDISFAMNDIAVFLKS